MFTAKFIIDERRKNALMLRITNNRKKVCLAMGLSLSKQALENALSENVKPENISYRVVITHWQSLIEDVKIGLLKERRQDEDVFVIRELLRDALLTDSDAKQAAPDPTPQLIVEELRGTFVPFYMGHLTRYDRRSTRESNEYTLSVMNKFSASEGFSLDAMNFEDVNYAWLSDFEIWMKRKGLSQNTRKIHFGNIRTAMRDAYKRELTDADPFRRFSFRPAKTRKRSLSLDRLRVLFSYPVAAYAEIYRDMMKLSFMLLGMNTIDLYNLKEIRDGRVEYDRSKTGGLFSIKIEPEAMEIIEKYKGVKNLLMLADRWGDHRNFRHQLNAAIKRIGKAQGKGVKDKEGDGPFAEVTSYWMRHTWATIAAELNIPDATISLALGHEGGENRTTNIYIKRNQKKIDDANRRVLDWVLYGKNNS